MPPLQLDDRQRAMLLEMGVRVWMPVDGPQDTPEASRVLVPPPQVQQAGRLGHPQSGTRPGQQPDPQPVARSVDRPAARPTPEVPVGAHAVPTRSEPARLAPVAEAHALPPTADWASLQQAVANCAACGLCQGRSQSTLRVPPYAQADWLVLGDAPDEEEDAQGLAFAGASGELLDNMLRALHLQRINAVTPPASEVPRMQAAYATSALKCRAPHGVQPQAADLQQCTQWLQREVALLQPRMILAMGRFANQVVLADTPEHIGQPLDRLRGQVYRFAGVPVVLTYHPKVLMRTPDNKAKAWADLCLAADILEAD